MHPHTQHTHAHTHAHTQIQGEPKCCQNVTLNVIPQNSASTPTSPSVHTLTTTSPAVAPDMLSPASFQLLPSPALSSLTAISTISQPPAFIQSPPCYSTMGPPTSSSSSAHTQLTNSTTPQVHPQTSLPPIRLVQPVSQTGNPSLTSPGQKQVQHSTMVTRESLLPMVTTAGGVENRLLEENPFPHVSSRAGVNTQVGRRGKKQAGKLARRKEESPLVTKRIQTRSGGRKRAFDVSACACVCMCVCVCVCTCVYVCVLYMANLYRCLLAPPQASPPPPSSPPRNKQALTPERRQTRSFLATTPSRNVPSSPTRARGTAHYSKIWYTELYAPVTVHKTCIL